MLFNKLNNWLKSSLRLILTAFICGLLFISIAYPVQAGTTSNPTDKEAKLKGIQAETEKVGQGDANPMGLEETIKRAQQGTNEVQGGADKEKMVKPEDTNATTVKDQAADLLNNLKPN